MKDYQKEGSIDLKELLQTKVIDSHGIDIGLIEDFVISFMGEMQLSHILIKPNNRIETHGTINKLSVSIEEIIQLSPIRTSLSKNISEINQNYLFRDDPTKDRVLFKELIRSEVYSADAKMLGEVVGIHIEGQQTYLRVSGGIFDSYLEQRDIETATEFVIYSSLVKEIDPIDNKIALVGTNEAIKSSMVLKSDEYGRRFEHFEKHSELKAPLHLPLYIWEQ